MSDIIEMLAAKWQAIANPAGVDWPRYAADGGVLGTAYLEELMSAVGATPATGLYDVVGGLDIEQRYRELRASDARAALTGLTVALKEQGAEMLEAANAGIFELPFQQALKMSRETMKDAIATMAAYTANGISLHLDGVIRDGLALGEISEAEAMEHADTVVRNCRTFTQMFEDGVFDEIERPPAVSGLGVFVIPAWMVVVGFVVLALGLGYLAWSTYRASVLQDRIVAWCEKLIATDEKNAENCIKSLNSMQSDALANLFGPVNDVVKWLGIGLVVYVAILAAPTAIRGLVEAKRSTA